MSPEPTVAPPSGPGAARTPAPLLLEFSTEVCNPVGGIYQVIRSKAPFMIERWGERYCLVGPYVEPRAALEFEPHTPSGRFASLIQQLKDDGIGARFGTWLVSGKPQVILLESWLPAHRLDELKFLLWREHAIQTPAGDHAVDLAVSFAHASLTLLRRAAALWALDRPGAVQTILAHFHEWLGALAIPGVRRERLPVACAFTTHATLLGRYMASAEESFYDRLSSVDQDLEASRYNIRGQHAIERACAHGAHVFTTVSPITGEECSQLLGRKPDVITPNGLNTERYDVGHEFQTQHAQFKAAIHRFTMGYFFPSYTFDLDRTVYMFTSGRFEPRNKGFDLCLEAMARLNAQLKDFGLPTTVVFFLVSQRPVRSINPQALYMRGVLNELREVCSHIMEHVGEKLFPAAARGERVNIDQMVDAYWALRYRRTQQALKISGLPPVVTHVLEDDARDPVLNHLRALGLFNRPEDPVKIAYHPEFISPASPLWGIEYDQFVRGCHLGIFPSAYEPWGYTPQECIAMGTPAVTSDLAGFGRYAVDRFSDPQQWGLVVLKRRGRSFHDAAADLARWLLEYCRLDRRGRIDRRNRVESHAGEFDWSKMVRAYHQAHDIAVTRAALVAP